MDTATGQSQRRDPGAHTHDKIDGDTGQIQLPASSRAGLYCADVPPWAMSGLLATALCIATVILSATLVLTVAEEARNAPVVTHTTMLVLAIASGVTWIAVVLVAGRDRLVRSQQGLRSLGETMLARQQELYVRQDHLAHRITDLTNRQVEQMQLLRQVADDMAAVRREIADVIGVADADAEMQVRKAVNGRWHAQAGLHVVPVEPPES